MLQKLVLAHLQSLAWQTPVAQWEGHRRLFNAHAGAQNPSRPVFRPTRYRLLKREVTRLQVARGAAKAVDADGHGRGTARYKWLDVNRAPAEVEEESSIIIIMPC